MIRKYNVNIMIAKGGYNGDDGALHCESMSESQMRGYLRHLASIKSIPANCCLRYIDAQVDIHAIASVYLSDIGQKWDYSGQEPRGGFKISLLMKNECKCSKQNCYSNIQNGKCTDGFVTNVIGKKFFPNKYKDINKKQR